LNLHGVNDVRQTEIHTAEPLVSEPSTFGVNMAVEKLKRYKSPGIDQIPVNLIKAEARTIRFEILQPINSIWNKEELPEQWNESTIVSIYKKGTKQYGNCRGIPVFSYIQNSAKHPSVRVNSTCRRNCLSVWYPKIERIKYTEL
jgi:hypothetical protein